MKNSEMREMIYQSTSTRETLYHGTYKGYEFYIMNLGTFPTAYVNVRENYLLNKKDYDEINIDVHGGLTYSEKYLCVDDDVVNGWFIGWDYAHCDDYIGLEMVTPEEFRTDGKKWTTEEIYEDVKNVIEQCINYKRR